MQRWFSLLVVCVIALAGCHSDSVKDSHAANIISAEFGLLNPSSTGGMVFTPTNTVPLVPYQSYGWQILLRDPPPTVKWKEEFTLPTKPASWGSAGSGGTRTLSADGKTLVTEAQVTPAQGMIANAWQILPGDPQGRYVMRVSVDGALVKTFQFDVQ